MKFFKILKATAVLLVVIALVSGCKKKEAADCGCTSTLNVHVEPTWDGQPLMLNHAYTNVSGYRVLVSNLRMYLSNMEAIKENGTRVKLSDIELADAEAGNTEFSYQVPSGSYQGIAFGIGVPQSMNGTSDSTFNPAQYPSDSPLSVTNGTYWSWQAGYRFVMFDGYYDTLATDTSNVLPGFSFHAGRDTCYRSMVMVNNPVKVVGSSLDLYLTFDVSRFFYSANDTIDLKTENNWHGSLSNLDVAIKLMDNMKAASGSHF